MHRDSRAIYRWYDTGEIATLALCKHIMRLSTYQVASKVWQTFKLHSKGVQRRQGASCWRKQVEHFAKAKSCSIRRAQLAAFSVCDASGYCHVSPAQWRRATRRDHCCGWQHKITWQLAAVEEHTSYETRRWQLRGRIAHSFEFISPLLSLLDN